MTRLSSLPTRKRPPGDAAGGDASDGLALEQVGENVSFCSAVDGSDTEAPPRRERCMDWGRGK